MSPRVVLFDLDGTLVDSVADIAAGLDAVLAEHGHEPLGESAVRPMIGDGAAMLLRRGFAARGAVEVPAGALERFHVVYGDRCVERTRPYPGIEELLARLTASGRALAVVTNKPQALSERLLRGLGLDAWFACVVGPERVAEKKPSAEHVLGALRLLRASPSEAVLVGDGSPDVLSGRAAGVRTIGVTWGFRPVEELRRAGAETIVSSVEELARGLEA